MICIFSADSTTRSLNMYNYGNKSNFDFDDGLKVLMKLNESDDFYYNMPLRGAQVIFILIHLTVDCRKHT